MGLEEEVRGNPRWPHQSHTQRHTHTRSPELSNRIPASGTPGEGVAPRGVGLPTQQIDGRPRSMTLNAAPPSSSSNWPHPLDAVFDNGKRRRKQYFPEGLHGMYMLSKTEISDDIDLIEADADRTAFGHARRRACRVNSSKDEMDVDQEFGYVSAHCNDYDRVLIPCSEAGSTAGTLAANKATKRQRLLDRFLDEHGIRDDARIELTKVCCADVDPAMNALRCIVSNRYDGHLTIRATRFNRSAMASRAWSGSWVRLALSGYSAGSEPVSPQHNARLKKRR